MALILTENPGLINGSNDVEEIEIPEIDAGLLMSLLEESQCEEYSNEEQVNSLMESLEAEIRMVKAGSCSIEGDIGSNDYFEWSEMEMVPCTPSDDMNWYVEDHVEDIINESHSRIITVATTIKSRALSVKRATHIQELLVNQAPHQVEISWRGSHLGRKRYYHRRNSQLMPPPQQHSLLED
ncbi:hypothetical protein J1N35_003822 [Gossypium stocksii]|uniref:Uncharacterized protein n=1 Tax=Gossypium stocksii TaxID=47602 RepID=A0A9D4AFG9_9ROSI|nr:hypothetical protein J1N35_003822 [Gossypium stocksii]